MFTEAFFFFFLSPRLGVSLRFLLFITCIEFVKVLSEKFKSRLYLFYMHSSLFQWFSIVGVLGFFLLGGFVWYFCFLFHIFICSSFRISRLF